MKRRAFIQQSSLATGSLLIPKFLDGFQWSSKAFEGKRLVVIQLGGGNDGLNTVVPYRNDIYYRLRPKLALRGDDIISLTDDLAINKAMTGLAKLYDDGQLTIINNVGYPNPNRSHFRSMDIWQTASSADEYLQSGWLGRYLDNQCAGSCSAHAGLEIDSSLSLAMKGERIKGMALANIENFKKMTDDELTRGLSKINGHENHQVDYLYKTLRETMSSADYITEKSKIYKSKQIYPFNEFGKRLKTMAELINSGVDSQVYYAGISGFDTHVFQKNTQNNLLKQVSEGLSTFVKDLKINGNLDDTLIMVFSEFGRRVKQNASNGTDHGAANNLYLIGGKLFTP